MDDLLWTKAKIPCVVVLLRQFRAVIKVFSIVKIKAHLSACCSKPSTLQTDVAKGQNKVRNTCNRKVHPSHWVIPTQMGGCFKFLPCGGAYFGHQTSCRLVRMVWGCSTHTCRGFYCFWPHPCTWFWLSTFEVVEFLILIQILLSELQPCAEWSLICKGLLRFQFLSKTRKSWKYWDRTLGLLYVGMTAVLNGTSVWREY